MPTCSELADTFARMERHDYRVGSIHLNEEDFQELMGQPGIQEVFQELDVRPRGTQDGNVGVLRGYLWGAAVHVSNVVPPGTMVQLPELEFLTVPIVPRAPEDEVSQWDRTLAEYVNLRGLRPMVPRLVMTEYEGSPEPDPEPPLEDAPTLWDHLDEE
jgi:hypothetical protein